MSDNETWDREPHTFKTDMDERVLAYCRQALREARARGEILRFEFSNETMHIDPETGALVSDSYTEERIEIPPR